jgi:hypothetical protein
MYQIGYSIKEALFTTVSTLHNLVFNSFKFSTILFQASEVSLSQEETVDKVLQL